MAGVIFVIAIAIVTLAANLERSQTWLPLAGMLGAGLVGLADDVLNIYSTGGIAGMQAKVKLFLYSLIALVGGWWFYAKLDVTSIYLPGIHNFHLGWLIIILFWLGRRVVDLFVRSLCSYCAY
jgi:UDP-N-acetylmuramyl pentapeptide phosphotransferase/UDP-N-acetylglucosamine-1-phosphate transferase